MKRVCVFAGSRPGNGDGHLTAARELGRTLAARGLGLVYGGGRAGLMGALADAALEGGGQVIGVIPDHMAARDLAHPGLSELRVVGSMHERKATMARLADAFVALPGGLGTLEESFEALTWTQLGLHAKPFGFLDAGGYYADLLSFLDHATEQRFMAPEHRALVLVAGGPDALLDALAAFRPPRLDKAEWILRDGSGGR
jgi:uncharacterized protein (TIGR00730 family)